MSYQYFKKELNYKVGVLHVDKHESLSRVDNIIFHGFDQACTNYSGKFAISLWHPKKEFRNEFKKLIALAGSSTTLTIYYTSNFLPPLDLFFCQYGISI